MATAYRRIFFLIVVIFFYNNLTAQDLGVQVAPGLMNYGGDLQNKVYTFDQANFSVSAGLIYSINQFSLRGSFTYGKVSGDDARNTKFKYRNLSFFSTVSDVNLCLQYDIYSLDNGARFTPYFLAGLGVFHFNPYTFYNSEKYYLRPLGTEGEGLAAYPGKKVYPLTQMDIPLGVGVKYKLSDRFLLGIEFNSRFLFTDYLDDVSTNYPDENELFKAKGQLAVGLSFRGDEIDPSLPFPSNSKRGNANNDNFYTSSLTITYILPKHISFGGNGEKTRKSSRKLNCPKPAH